LLSYGRLSFTIKLYLFEIKVCMFSKPEKNFFNTLFTVISEAAIIVDSFQKIKVINPAAQRLFGFKEKELLNKPINTIIAAKKLDKKENFRTNFSLEEEVKIDLTKGLQGIHKEEKVFPLELKLNSVEFENEKFVILLITNTFICEEHNNKILETNVKERTRRLSGSVEKLEKMNQQLDEENKKRIEAENKATIALKKERELSELKTKFLSMVSHEFKTPLSGISISTMLLRKYNLTEHQDKRDKHLSVINSKVHYLNSILNNFLSIEKLEKQEIEYTITTFKIKKVLDEVINNANLLFKEGQEIVCISNFDNIVIDQDQKIIELTLSNLISNAIKYSDKNTKIFVTVEQDEKETIFKIIDKGFGIPKEEQKNIFKRYYRAENVLLIEGTGIGLNIIKTHVENIGGSIKFKSEQNVGTTFTVRIPNKFN